MLEIKEKKRKSKWQGNQSKHKAYIFLCFAQNTVYLTLLYTVYHISKKIVFLHYIFM